MREAIWGYAIIVLGILAIGIIWFFANSTRTDQHNYNLLKETVEAAMFDAVDLSEYRKDGSIVIDEEKFVENFIRRFAESADLSNRYEIEIFDINTEPPKVSLRVSSTQSTSATGEIVEFDIVNNIDAILETKFEKRELSCDETFHCSDSGGSTYQCYVNANTTKTFYMLKDNGNYVTLIMNENYKSADVVTRPVGTRDAGFAKLVQEWYSGARIPNVKEIQSGDYDPYTTEKNKEIPITGPAYLYENLSGIAYWALPSTKSDGWCVYKVCNSGVSGCLRANTDVWGDRWDCGFRPVIDVDKQCIN